MTNPTPTLTDEQRERIAEALHAAGTGGAPCWPDCHEEEWYRDQAEALAPLVARMVADAEQRGRAEVSAAVEALCSDNAARIKAEAWDYGASEAIRMHDRHKAWMLVNPYRADRIGGGA